VVLEPTFAAYHLSHATAQEHGNAYSGTNFSLPHRDYTHADSFDAHGAPKVLTLWVPVSEVAPDNGCMMVVPREFDPYHDRDDAARHMLVQHSGWLAGKSFLAFPLGGARALAPAAPATVMGWAGSTIHWGTNCHAGAAGRPRASIAWVFKRADAPHAPVAPPLARADVAALSLARRRPPPPPLLLPLPMSLLYTPSVDSSSTPQAGAGAREHGFLQALVDPARPARARGRRRRARGLPRVTRACGSSARPKWLQG